MPSFAEAAATPHTPVDKRIRCRTRDWIDALEPAEADGARALLADITRVTTDLYKVFADNGFPLQYDALVRHRNGRCSCR